MASDKARPLLSISKKLLTKIAKSIIIILLFCKPNDVKIGVKGCETLF